MITIRTIHYSTMRRRHRRYAVRHITDALCNIYDAEYNYAESLMSDDPDNQEYIDARYNADALLDVLSLLIGIYE